ncbi:unnamed protein product [Mytilus coruscus]|uniref:Reverse transcriptase domain-containing protein n=1 Tax=Mytilus coruscus TaxID=42192 RepID=A0A6J7ZSD3_MYTCO|nr:unnamed protein product [Mytilus coruscus]
MARKNDHLKTDKILAQRNLRKQLRKEQYLDRTQFYNELMDNPSNDMFHKLIRRNRGSKNKDAICIMENGEHHYSATDQTNSFSRYFEDLAVPKDNGYDSEFLDLCNIRHNIFDELCKQSSNEPQFSFQNICDAIQQLHSGKATDELGLAAEHFKNSPTTVTHFLTNCFNNIFNNHHIPDIFKSGIVTPVLKKGKNPMLMDNYRGIAVTPVISKLFECTILPRLTVNFNQSPLQFGFTKGLSMLMASLIITEARAEVKLVTMEPLFLITVDSQKAFDVVDHIILLDALYDHTQNHPLWSIVKNLYSGLVSRVKWKGTISDSFNIHQGVRQGGILSPFLYKVYVNNLLEDLKSHNLGLKIGTNYVGCPTCADDIAFLSSSHQELQCMLSVATHHARQSRVTINPTKTKAVILNKPKNINRSDLNWTLGNTPVYPSEDTTHLGLIRAELKENNLNSLPTRTATGSVFMLLGALTIEAEIHKRQLSFLYSVLSCNNSTIQGLVDRQIIMNIDNHLSFFCKVTGVLALYDLPSITTLSQNLPSKLKWKATVKLAIQDYWTKTLIKEIETKSSLTYLDKTLLRIGSTHPVWTSLSSTVSDVKKER